MEENARVSTVVAGDHREAAMPEWRKGGGSSSAKKAEERTLSVDEIKRVGKREKQSREKLK